MECCNITVNEFSVTYHNNNEKLIDYCVSHKLLLAELKCPDCDKNCIRSLKEKSFRCRRVLRKDHRGKTVRCTYYRSIFKNTFFAENKLGPYTTICFVRLFLLQSYSFELARESLGLSSSTITHLASICREICVTYALENTEKIGGVGKVVEVDEAKFGKHKYNIGKIIEGEWVFGGFCRTTKKIFLVPMQKRDSTTLVTLIQKYIAPGTKIIGDCWKAYCSLDDSEFQDLTVNHSVNFVDPVDGAHTQNIEKTWISVKASVSKSGHRKAHFLGHLARALFFKNLPVYQERVHQFLLAVGRLYNPGY